jgi:N-acetylmuramoyl-L-alanine amidase
VRDKVRWQIKFLPVKQSNNVQLQLDIISISGKQTKPSIAPLPVPVPVTTPTKPLQTSSESQKLVTVVIDPGHGGHDSGAIGPHGTMEKNVVLAIARNLANEINQTKNMRAVLTRDDDHFVTLRNRLRLARKGKADVFIAIHADAYLGNNARGASVYALSKHGATSEAARWLAQKDNYSELDDLELNALQDRSPILRSVLIDMAQTATIQDSLQLGQRVLHSIDEVSPLHYKKVEQAPFVVLKSPDIPSILIETGFISNAEEERQLSTPRYQQELARAIFQGIKRYQA